MAGKQDRRVRRSRAAIFGAFERLLTRKSYASITVGEVIAEADVGRTTFYAHFQTKDALLEELCRDLFSHVASPTSEPDSGHSFAENEGIERELLHMAMHLEEESQRLGPLFSGPAAPLFWEFFAAELERYFLLRMGRSIARKAQVDDGLYARYLASSFVEVARWQLVEGTQDPRQMADTFIALSGIRPMPAAALGENAPSGVASGKCSAVKPAVKTALSELLEESKLDALTVGEVAAAAHVGRSTFYAHYKNLGDAYTDLLRDAWTDVQALDEHFQGVFCGHAGAPAGKIPFCCKLRMRGGASGVLKDPAFGRTWLKLLWEEEGTCRLVDALVESGLTCEQAQAVYLFQVSGCLMAALSLGADDAAWARAQEAIDVFVQAGYGAVSKGKLP